MNINQTSTEARQENSANGSEARQHVSSCDTFFLSGCFFFFWSNQEAENTQIKPNFRRRDAFGAPSSGWETKLTLRIWDYRGFGFPRHGRGSFSQAGEVLAIITLKCGEMSAPSRR